MGAYMGGKNISHIVGTAKLKKLVNDWLLTVHWQVYFGLVMLKFDQSDHIVRSETSIFPFIIGFYGFDFLCINNDIAKGIGDG